jgi:endo-1,3(4)-beta-glucanase
MHDLLHDVAAAQVGLTKLQASFAVFASNKQQYPLVYESAWGGIVSSASYVTGDSGADFGNTYYNDHHFHYGYFIYTAAVIGYLDPSWVPANKDFVNTLVRDIANPSMQDPHFPVSRNYDWYHGHSWAHGLYESFDGKDQESSSEDSMSAYAVKMWGQTVGDSNMEARGNLQLAVTARALQKYYLYESDNVTEPANIIGNKVAGILFENKIDHTTYFGANIEYIQGIHMLPLLPSTLLTRTTKFVTEEWNTYFSNGRVDSITGGWRGILYANLATIDPRTAWKFFSQPNFDMSLLDGGASLTWYLAFAAGMLRSDPPCPMDNTDLFLKVLGVAS